MKTVALFAAIAGGAALLGCAPTPAPSTGDPGYKVVTDSEGRHAAEIDATGKGAVLCAWMLYSAAEQIGETCFKGQDSAYQAELRNSLARIDRFIIANSPERVTQAQLDARRTTSRRENLAAASRTGGLCTGEMRELYTAFRTVGADGLRAGVDDLLSIPRKPVFNPCV
jgi:16S rRNA C1402 (ribose-2'-O) methylase RsmI